jgi:hypothetical protein
LAAAAVVRLLVVLADQFMQDWRAVRVAVQLATVPVVLAQAAKAFRAALPLMSMAERAVAARLPTAQTQQRLAVLAAMVHHQTLPVHPRTMQAAAVVVHSPAQAERAELWVVVRAATQPHLVPTAQPMQAAAVVVPAVVTLRHAQAQMAAVASSLSALPIRQI